MVRIYKFMNASMHVFRKRKSFNQSCIHLYIHIIVKGYIYYSVLFYYNHLMLIHNYWDGILAFLFVCGNIYACKRRIMAVPVCLKQHLFCSVLCRVNVSSVKHTTAKASCSEQGAHLMKVTTSAKLAFIFELLACPGIFNVYRMQKRLVPSDLGLLCLNLIGDTGTSDFRPRFTFNKVKRPLNYEVLRS